jgi:dimethylamine monooxygenase subunit A
VSAADPSFVPAWDPAWPLPFADGPPRIHVGLKPIPAERWLRPDDQAHWLPGKRALIEADPAAVFAQLPGSLSGQAEVAAMIGADLRVAPDPGEPPLLAAARLVSDDLVLMEPRDEGWTATALCLCAPTFFGVDEAIGGSLQRLHGPVPGGDPGLAGRIGRVFSLMDEAVVLERFNWTVQWGPGRHTPTGAPLRAAAQAAELAEAAGALHLRVERQTIRRLPATGGVLFTIRIRLARLADLLDTAERRAAFASAWADTPDEVAAYKRWAPLQRHVAWLLAERGCV